MKKKYSFFNIGFLLLIAHCSYSQTTTHSNTYIIGNLTNDTIEICQDDSVHLIASNTYTDIINSNFNNSGLDSAWTSNLTVLWSNPCPPAILPANGVVCWLGSNSYPRELMTKSFSTSTASNCRVEWDMKYGGNQNSLNCESPDIPNEGVHFMYSVNNGNIWTQFPGTDQSPSGVYGDTSYVNGSGGYWTPVPGNAATGPYYSWNHYSNALPAAALSPATKIRWYQDIASGNNFDHWGIDNVRISCGSTSNYSWSNGTTGNSITVMPTISTWFYVTITDTTLTPQISTTDSVFVMVHPIPPTPVINILGDSLYSSSVTGNQWYLNSHPIIGATGNYYIATLDGNYQVVVGNAFECFSDTSNTITLIGVGIHKNPMKTEFCLHPNPSSEYFSIQTKENITLVQIFDISGKSVKSFKTVSPTMNYNIKDLDKGIYFVKIYTHNNLSVQKLIKR